MGCGTARSPTATAASAGEARNDDIEETDDGTDDGLEDGSDTVNDGHETCSDGLEDALNLGEN